MLLVLSLLILWPPASTAGGPPPTLQGEAALNHLKEQGLYGSLQEPVTIIMKNMETNLIEPVVGSR